MKIFIFSFTDRGAAVAARVKRGLEREYGGGEITAYGMEKYAEKYGLECMRGTLRENVGSVFTQGSALIFVGACGIAVRGIAPFVRDKKTDACVVAVDEMEKYVVPLLSGHIGGGNDMARAVARVLDATAVISTATDLHGCFAVDVFARKNGLWIANMAMAKKISAALLDGETVGYDGIMPTDELPDGVVRDDAHIHGLGICVSPFADAETKPFAQTLYLVPRQVVLGIGCKRGIPAMELHEWVAQMLQEQHINAHAIRAIASIDLKKDETCLLSLAASYGVPFVTYDADTLAAVQGSHSSSDYVREVTGVDNVCERAALACAGTDVLYLSKTVSHGKTLAIALAPVTIQSFCEP